MSDTSLYTLRTIRTLHLGWWLNDDLQIWLGPANVAQLTIQSFDLPPYQAQTQAFADVLINDKGVAAGVAMRFMPAQAGGRLVGQTAFVYDHGTIATDYSPTQSVYNAIYPAPLEPTKFTLHGTTYTATPHGESQDGQWLVGSAGAAGSFVEHAGTFEQYTANTNITPETVNDLGQIVGTYWTSDNVGNGFIDDHGRVTTIDGPNAFYTVATGVSDAGEVVGWYSQNVGGQAIDHGFIDWHGTFQTFDVPTSKSTEITGINNHGQIVGWWSDAAGARHGFIATPSHSA